MCLCGVPWEGMSYLLINNPGTTLSVDQTNFTLRAKGRKLARLPAMIIDGIIVEGHVEVTRKALGRLGRSGIPVTFLDEQGRVQSRLVPGWGHDPAPRLGQSALALDPAASLIVARHYVKSKILNQAAVLRSHLRNHPDDGIASIRRRLLETIARVDQAETTESLFGHEGAAARLYFSAFGTMIRCDWTTFTARSRRPPLDPVNSTLSYAYAVIQNRITSLAETVGLDPYIGCLHPSTARRPSFSLDFMEPFRPALADRLVLSLFNRRVLRPEHFDHRNQLVRSENADEGGARYAFDREVTACYLNAAGREAFARHAASWFPSCNDDLADKRHSPDGVLSREIQSFQRLAARRDLTSYQPYLLEPDAKAA